ALGRLPLEGGSLGRWVVGSLGSPSPNDPTTQRPNDPTTARDLLDRYETIQEFLRTSRQFGSQRQQNEKLAVSIALENLARTAGFPDPVRLEWAMEAQAIADLAGGGLVAQAGPAEVTLAVNEAGDPGLTGTKGG